MADERSSVLGTVAVMVGGLALGGVAGAMAPPAPVHLPSAPGATNSDSLWAPSRKSFVGTSAGQSSHVYFTGHKGIVTEVFYPTVDCPNVVDFQFLVGDTDHTWVDEEKLQDYQASRPDPKSLLWTVQTRNLPHAWQITKRVFTDTSRNSLIQRVHLESLDGRPVQSMLLYVLLKPALNNSAQNDTGNSVTQQSRAYLVANDSGHALALATSLGWTMDAGKAMISTGYLGTSDGWQDLLGGSSPDFRMDWQYDSAQSGNIAQMGWVDTQSQAGTSVDFDVVLGFGQSQDEALQTAAATLASDLTAAEGAYNAEWNRYASGLNNYGGQADNEYYLSAMTLHAVQDKTNGAMIAGPGTPWGDQRKDDSTGGYHRIWARDLFKFANALATAGDGTGANAAVEYLFNVAMQKVSGDGSTIGRFPQNTWVSGAPGWNGTQMDESAMPVILAWRLRRQDLWPLVRLAADFVAQNGPRTDQERWEETAGYSPSTIAAEIAGLVCAADMAKTAGDTDRARTYLAKADFWQQNVANWTFTTTGKLGNGRYYIRITSNLDPNDGQHFTVGNGGGDHDERDVIDVGFLELVRMGVKAADDPTILDTIPEYDAMLHQDVPGKGPAYFRYNYDGYGEQNNGDNYDGSHGRGRLWPIFTAERGMFEIARATVSGSTSAGTIGKTYLSSLGLLTTPEGFIPEQIWNVSPGPAGWETDTPSPHIPGDPTNSMAPLSWAMGEYINLLASIVSNKVIDIPSVVCARYVSCPVAPDSGMATLNMSVTASTVLGEYVYVTGNLPQLGNWDPGLSVPVNSRSYPTWTQHINLPANTALEYKYLKRRADGTFAWEQKGGNRTITLPPAGQAVSVGDQVNW